MAASGAIARRETKSPVQLLAAMFVSMAVLVMWCGFALADEGAVGDVVYRLDADDKVKVTVFEEPNLSGEFQVDGGGSISMPLIGAVPARGLTIPQLEDAIISRLKPRYLLNPRVSVEVADARPFYIMGQVSNPGAYPYKHNMTVPNAIALAGGYTPRANTGKVLIRRGGKGDEVKFEPDNTTIVLPGDIIRVRERFF